MLGLTQQLVLTTLVFAHSHTVQTATVLMIAMNMMLVDHEDGDDKDNFSLSASYMPVTGLNALFIHYLLSPHKPYEVETLMVPIYK